MSTAITCQSNLLLFISAIGTIEMLSSENCDELKSALENLPSTTTPDVQDKAKDLVKLLPVKTS